MIKLTRRISILLALLMLLQINGVIVSAAYQTRYDLNNDGLNDVTDMTLMSLYLCGDLEPSNISKYDIDGNRIISYRDYVELKNHINNVSM